MARNDKRDQLIRTFMSRSRRKGPGINQGFPSNPGGTPAFKPQKQGQVRQYRPRKRARY